MTNHRGWRPGSGHELGARLDNIRHACPDCVVGRPRSFCPTCLGVGSISEARLAVWQIEQDQQIRDAAAPAG